MLSAYSPTAPLNLKSSIGNGNFAKFLKSVNRNNDKKIRAEDDITAVFIVDFI